jgi:hypothetical protein
MSFDVQVEMDIVKRFSAMMQRTHKALDRMFDCSTVYITRQCNVVISGNHWQIASCLAHFISKSLSSRCELYGMLAIRIGPS